MQNRKEVQNATDLMRADSTDCSSTDAILRECCSSLRVAQIKGKGKEKNEREVHNKQEIYRASTEGTLTRSEYKLYGMSSSEAGASVVNTSARFS